MVAVFVFVVIAGIVLGLGVWWTIVMRRACAMMEARFDTERRTFGK
jgi:hypothetical protein